MDGEDQRERFPRVQETKLRGRVIYEKKRNTYIVV